VIQAYLHRSAEDVLELNRRRIGVRLCKGAYDEPAAIAFRRSEQSGENFRKLWRSLLIEGSDPALATHDEGLIRELVAFAKQHAIPKERYEIQMLYGIRRDLQARYAGEGYRVRVYVPFGEAWYPYFMRRLAERPENLYFVVRNLFRS
jgi:proline dehydrogenase